MSKVPKLKKGSICPAIGEANAESYKKQVVAMGEDNFTQLKVVEQIAEGKIKIIPELLITGGDGNSGSPISALLGMELLGMVRKEHGKETLIEVGNTASKDVTPGKDNTKK